MRIVLLFLVFGLVIGCESAPKKDEKGKAAPAAAGKAKDAKAAKADKTKKGFEDEDISKTKPAAGKSEGKITCVNGGDTRTLEMTSGEGKVCRLIYTKAGEGKEVASGTADATKCNEVRDRIKGNLEGSGFKCE